MVFLIVHITPVKYLYDLLLIANDTCNIGTGTALMSNDEATIQHNASEKGLGATILQHRQPVTYESVKLVNVGGTELYTNRKEVPCHCVGV